MRIKKATIIAAVALASVTTVSKGQDSGLNTFSPYTFYGLGNLSVQGSTMMRSMGGAGIAYRDPTSINYLNPASFSAMPRKAFLFGIGVEGANYYLRNSESRTVHNTFNVRDIAVQFPLGKKIAVGISVTPFSSIGYNMVMKETDPEIIGNIGDVRYRFVGEGDITQAKAGIGWELFKNFSVGAEMVYYFGDLTRSYHVDITPITGEGTYVNTSIYNEERVSRILWNFGVQYSPVFDTKRVLTLGAAYHPQGKLNPKVSVTASGNYSIAQIETVLPNSIAADFSLPHSATAGLYYHTSKVSAGFDYTYQGWQNANPSVKMDNATFRNTSTFKAGLEYTPNRYDVRRFMRRLTYRGGLRYGDYYMRFNDNNIKDMAVTAGIGIPLGPARLSNINIGVEYGSRGTTKNRLIREDYFKFSLGFSLFGTDDWFKKYKYD